jgi:hypothetical protein
MKNYIYSTPTPTIVISFEFSHDLQYKINYNYRLDGKTYTQKIKMKFCFKKLRETKIH